VSLQQTRILLSYNDADGCGYLRETELSAYVEQMMASLPPLANLDPSMKAQYNRIAVRKLMFFNDPHRLGKVKIADLLVRTNATHSG
jgi:serine/threonine-protein phosphatase 2A regulatory subunit B''